MSSVSQATPRAIAFKITAIVLIAFFLFAAVGHYSDPDPIHWILFYLTSALCCLLTVVRKDNLALLYVSLGMAVMEIAATGDGFLVGFNEAAVMEKSYFVLRRDFLGAFVSLLVSVCLVIRLRSSARKPKG
jgi:Transmembrane family 220, helix